MRRTVVVAAIVGLTWGGIGALTSVAQAAPPSTNVACGDTGGLVAAIDSANNGGLKTIDLASNCTYTLTSPANGSDGLPVITSSITLNGSGSTVTRDATATSQFRIIEIGVGGKLAASALTVSGGHAPDGVNGTNGANGADGVCPPPAPGGNGTSGTDGTNGANGGAILVDSGGGLSLSSATVDDNFAGSGGAGGSGGNGGNSCGGGPNIPGGNAGNGGAGGSGGSGGGVYVSSGATASLGSTTVTNNDAGNAGIGGAGGTGGSDPNPGPATGGNGGNGGAGGSGGSGGGIFNAGSASIANSFVTNNNAGTLGTGGQGGQGGTGGSGCTVNCTGANGTNGTDGNAGSGGGIFNSGKLHVKTITLTGNMPDQCSGAGCP